LALLEIPALARHAIRTLRTQPLFTATTVATFALGIGRVKGRLWIVVLILLANMLPKQRSHAGDWRTAG
jgi:hypothetical protein